MYMTRPRADRWCKTYRNTEGRIVTITRRAKNAEIKNEKRRRDRIFGGGFALRQRIKNGRV